MHKSVIEDDGRNWPMTVGLAVVDCCTEAK